MSIGISRRDGRLFADPMGMPSISFQKLEIGREILLSCGLRTGSQVKENELLLIPSVSNVKM